MDKEDVRARLKKVEGSVLEMGRLSGELADRLEKTEAFIQRMGWCPWCEKRLPVRGFYDPKACRHKIEPK